MSDFDFEEKIAAEALRAYPKLRKENLELKQKVAFFEKKEKVQRIIKIADLKQLTLDQTEEDLMKAAESKLADIERSINMVSQTNTKLAEVDDEDSGGKASSSEKNADMSVLDSFCADPHNFVDPYQNK